eukprot:TRINITY_DN7488_c0_g2_i1.p1 TRINITY_DN7488_c0_g2~~TRINITY_DN7488_c0_g2_i1.p1  ORF type:complete len:107 (+),score=4.47 TRINITY_DN7488_c0_g2_i1:26-346(+)
MIKLVVCYCLLFSYSVFAQCNATVKIAFINNSPPYSYLQGGQYEGIDVTMARKALQAVGVCFEFVEMPNVERAKRYLAMGKSQFDDGHSIHGCAESLCYLLIALSR